MENLRRVQEELRQRLRETRQSLKHHQRLHRKTCQDRERDAKGNLVIPKGKRALLLTMYIISQYSTSVPLMYATAKRKKKIFPLDSSEKEKRQAIEDLFLATDMSALENLTDPSTPLDQKRLRRAWRIYSEVQLVTWVKKMNYERGVAPKTKKVFAQMADVSQDAVQHGFPAAERSVLSSADRMWGTRWRRRWAGSISRIRTRSPMELQEMREKVFMHLFP